MLSIYHLKNTAHALTYYKEDNYYSKADLKEEHTEWYGNAALELKLKGKVKLKDFDYILNGYDKNGVSIVNKKVKEQKLTYEAYFKVKNNYEFILSEVKIEEDLKKGLSEIINNITKSNQKISSKILEKYNRKISSIINKSVDLTIDKKEEYKDKIKKENAIYRKTSERRPAFDLTFSAPKSVSFAAFIGEDENLIKAHRDAVKYALSVVEQEYSQTRVVKSNKKNIHITHNIIAATFEHDVSRKVDPQLHTHCVVMNLTKKDGEWRSLHQDGFYYNSKKIGVIYQNELANKVLKLGYEITLKPNGTFDIIGYTDSQLLHFSKRSAQIKDQGAHTQKEAREAVMINRDKKKEVVSREIIRAAWKEEGEMVQLKHQVPNTNKVIEPAINKDELLNKIIIDSIKELNVNEISFKRDVLHEKIMTKSLGIFDYLSEVKIKGDEFIKLNAHSVGEKYRQEFVTNNSLKIEADTIEIMQRGKEIFEGIVTIEKSRKLIDKINETSKLKGDPVLNEGQCNAIEMMLTSNDRIYAWQGVAGAGKSFSLGSACKIACEHGYIIKGFAPQAQAAKVLALEAELADVQTLESHLIKKSTPGCADGKEIWIVDEAGLLSARDAYLLLSRAEVENARVLLVGDIKQLSSVGAGNPFKQLQEHGIKLASLTQGMRQKNVFLKKSIDLIANGKHRDGLEILEKSGRIFEVEDNEKMIASMANDYLTLSKNDRDKSLFISSTNHEKEQITNIIRAELKRKEELRGYNNIKILELIRYNEFALKCTNVYSKDNILILHKDLEGLVRNMEYEILKIDHTHNTITVQNGHKEKKIEVSKIKGNLYCEKVMELSIGERVKWTKNHSEKKENSSENKERSERRLNGQYLNIIGINKENNTAIIEYENKKQETIDLNKRQFLDYNYVTTVYSSQGKTCDKVFASLTNVNRENFYVAVSRAKHDCKLYTNDKNTLYKNVERFSANKTAFEKIAESLKISSFKEKNVEENVIKLSENYLECIKISRKIKETSFEISYKLGLNPMNNELCKHSKFGKNNQEVIANSLNFEINKLLGINKSSQRESLPLETLQKTYKEISKDYAKECQSIYYHRLNSVPGEVNTKKLEQTVSSREAPKPKLRLR